MCLMFMLVIEITFYPSNDFRMKLILGRKGLTGTLILSGPLTFDTQTDLNQPDNFTRQWGTPGSQWVNHSLKNYVPINPLTPKPVFYSV